MIRTDNRFKVVALNESFFVAPLDYAGQEARASRREREASFKRAVASGFSVTERVLDNSGNTSEFKRTLKPDDAPGFGLTQASARSLAYKLGRAKVRNAARARPRS